MQFSNKILASLLVFGLANPSLANTEGEKEEDPNKPYYYIVAGTIVAGAVILGFFKRDAIIGCFKKKPTHPIEPIVKAEEQTMMVLTETVEESSEPFNSSQDGSNGDTSIMEVVPVLTTLVAAKLGEADTVLESTTTSSSTTTSIVGPTVEPSKAPDKKLARKPKSPEFLAKMKILDGLYAQVQSTGARNPEPTATTGSSSGLVKTKSRQFLQQSSKSEAVGELSLDYLPERKTVTNDPSDEAPLTESPALGYFVIDPQPLPPAQDPLYFNASEYTDTLGNVQIALTPENIIQFHADSPLGWIFVSARYDGLDDFMGASLPPSDFVYCFVNPDKTKMILSRALSEKSVIWPYKEEEFRFWRIEGASHSTICVQKIEQPLTPQDAREETPKEKQKKKEGKKEKKSRLPWKK